MTQSSQASQESRRDLRSRTRRAREDERTIEARRDDSASGLPSLTSGSRDIRQASRRDSRVDSRVDSRAESADDSQFESQSDARDIGTSVESRDDAAASDLGAVSTGNTAESLDTSASLSGASSRGDSGEAPTHADGSVQLDLDADFLATTGMDAAATAVQGASAQNPDFMDGVSSAQHPSILAANGPSSSVTTMTNAMDGEAASTDTVAGIASPWTALSEDGTSLSSLAWTAVDEALTTADAAEAGGKAGQLIDSRRTEALHRSQAHVHAGAGAGTHDTTRAALEQLERAFATTARAIETSTTSGEYSVRPAQDAVAGRLSEVEGNIARAQVATALESQSVQISIDDAVENAGRSGSDGDIEVRTAGGTMHASHFGSGASSTSIGGVSGSQGRTDVGDTLSTNLMSAQSAGTGANGGLASDLSPRDAETPAAARMAAKGASILANQRGGSITMRLEPPALGQLRIELRIAHGAVHADFTAATAEARVLLEANLGMLRERLESQGLSVDRITVHGGNRAESTVAQASQAGNDGRADAETRDRGGERSSHTRHDAADGESRGRRDGEGTRDGSRNAAQHGARGDRGSDATSRRGDRDFAQMFGATLENRLETNGNTRGAVTAEPSRDAGSVPRSGRKVLQ